MGDFKTQARVLRPKIGLKWIRSLRNNDQRFLQISKSFAQSSFLASEALHRMVYRAQRDPESRFLMLPWLPAEVYPRQSGGGNDGV